MSKNEHFSITSTIKFHFANSELRDFSFNSFIPEFERLQTKRSKISIEKKNDIGIVFKIISSDITAFRASINEIINFGRVITNSIEIISNSKK